MILTSFLFGDSQVCAGLVYTSFPVRTSLKGEEKSNSCYKYTAHCVGVQNNQLEMEITSPPIFSLDKSLCCTIGRTYNNLNVLKPQEQKMGFLLPERLHTPQTKPSKPNDEGVDISHPSVETPMDKTAGIHSDGRLRRLTEREENPTGRTSGYHENLGENPSRRTNSPSTKPRTLVSGINQHRTTPSIQRLEGDKMMENIHTRGITCTSKSRIPRYP